MRNLLLLVCLASAALAQQTQTGGNALASAESRFLRDASASHVAWRPWGQAAFDAARKADRPIFLSIGYASSWESQRLQREAFANPVIADSLNGYYMPVLVDRLELPEVAAAFDAMQKALSGTVTTPSSFVLTPGLEPVAVTTEVPAVILATNASRWANAREATIAEARANLAKVPGETRAPGEIDATTIDAVIAGIARGFNPANPDPMAVSFALRTQNKDARAIGLDALRKFAKSTRRDVLGGGYFRSETELEKLLSDQALIAIANLEAWQQTHEPVFEDVVRTTLDYVLRDLQFTKGGFHISQDAYSLVPGQGPEFRNGAFYAWTKDELRALIGDADPSDPAVRQKLFETRQKRPQPFREWNQLPGPNALMISALARTGAALNEPRYRDAASMAARGVTAKFKTGTSRDYALLVQAVLDVFGSTSDPKWLELAKTLQQKQDALFWNASLGRYVRGTSLPEPLRRLLIESDDDLPGVNAVSAMNLMRLAMLTGSDRARVHVIFQSFGGRLRTDGAHLPALAAALVTSYASPKIEVVAGDPRRKATVELLQSINQRWEPLRFVLLKDAALARALPFTAALTAGEKTPMAYVCEKGECRKK